MILFLVGLIQFILKAFSFLILIRIILSFVSPDPYNPIVQWVYRLTNPIFKPFKRFPLVIGMIDFTPMVVLLVVYVVGDLLVQILFSVAS